MSVPLSAPVGNRLLTNLSPEVQSQLQPGVHPIKPDTRLG
jgi:hypothetical protein